MSPEEGVAAAIELARRFAADRAASEAQRDLLGRAFTRFDGSRARPDSALPLPAAFLPLAAYNAFRGDATPAIPLAGATTMLYLGMDTFDSLMDGDPLDEWDGCTADEIMLAAALMTGALPQLAISELDASPATIVALQREVAAAGLSIGAGQHAELLLRGTAATPAEVQKSIEGKAGAMGALLVTLGCLLAEAPAEQASHLAAMAHAWAVAGQIATDIADLLQPDGGTDLVNGTHTLPIALYLDSLELKERDNAIGELATAATDVTVRTAVRSGVIQEHVVKSCILAAVLYLSQARQALNAAQLPEDRAQPLASLLGTLTNALKSPVSRGSR